MQHFIYLYEIFSLYISTFLDMTLFMSHTSAGFGYDQLPVFSNLNFFMSIENVNLLKNTLQFSKLLFSPNTRKYLRNKIIRKSQTTVQYIKKQKKNKKQQYNMI